MPDIDAMLKAELQDLARTQAAQIAALETRVSELTAALQAAQVATQAGANTPGLPRSCINCNQTHTQIESTAEGVYYCPVCQHTWTAADERAPFRQRMVR